MISEVDVKDAKDWPKARILQTGEHICKYRIEKNEPIFLCGVKVKDCWSFHAFTQTLEEADVIAKAIVNPIVKEYW